MVEWVEILWKDAYMVERVEKVENGGKPIITGGLMGKIGVLQTFFEKKFGFRGFRVVTLQRKVPVVGLC